MAEWFRRLAFTPWVSGSSPGVVNFFFSFFFFFTFILVFILELFSSDVYIYQFKAFNDKLQNMPNSVNKSLISNSLIYPEIISTLFSSECLTDCSLFIVSGVK